MFRHRFSWLGSVSSVTTAEQDAPLKDEVKPHHGRAKRAPFHMADVPSEANPVLFHSRRVYNHQWDSRASHFPPHIGNAPPHGLWSLRPLDSGHVHKANVLTQEWGTLTLLLDYSGNLEEPCHRREIERSSGGSVRKGQRRAGPSRFLICWKTWQETAGTSHISTTSPQSTLPHSEPQFWEPTAWQATLKEGLWVWTSTRTFLSLVCGFCCYFSFYFHCVK